MMKRCLILLLALLYPLTGHAQTSIIPLHAEEGGLTFTARINDIPVKTFYTQESWYISLSPTTYLFLYENGHIPAEDVKGTTVLKMPDGSSTKAVSLVIRELRMEKLLVRNVPAFVIKKQSVPMLLGNTAFGSVGTVTGDDNQITVVWDEEYAQEEAAREVLTPTDSLKHLAQNYLDEKDYGNAATVFAGLYQEGALDMFTHYQYCMLLPLEGTDAQVRTVSQEWLRKYAGRSPYMDYWIYDGLGEACRRMKEPEPAISWYMKALETYYALYNTSEEALRKGTFHDEDLGRTLLALGQAYALDGKLFKGEKYCVLSAKCGYAPAKEFCDKYKMKY